MAKKKPDPKPRAAAPEPAPVAPSTFSSGKKIGRPKGSKNKPKEA